jgi:hypothetical protein
MGSDFAIDDIEVRICRPPITLTVDNPICNGSTIKGEFTNTEVTANDKTGLPPYSSQLYAR